MSDKRDSLNENSATTSQTACFRCTQCKSVFAKETLSCYKCGYGTQDKQWYEIIDLASIYTFNYFSNESIGKDKLVNAAYSQLKLHCEARKKVDYHRNETLVIKYIYPDLDFLALGITPRHEQVYASFIFTGSEEEHGCIFINEKAVNIDGLNNYVNGGKSTLNSIPTPSSPETNLKIAHPVIATTAEDIINENNSFGSRFKVSDHGTINYILLDVITIDSEDKCLAFYFIAGDNTLIRIEFKDTELIIRNPRKNIFDYKFCSPDETIQQDALNKLFESACEEFTRCLDLFILRLLNGGTDFEDLLDRYHELVDKNEQIFSEKFSDRVKKELPRQNEIFDKTKNRDNANVSSNRIVTKNADTAVTPEPANKKKVNKIFLAVIVLSAMAFIGSRVGKKDTDSLTNNIDVPQGVSPRASMQESNKIAQLPGNSDKPSVSTGKFKIVQVAASSQIANTGNFNYDPKNVLDTSGAKAWCAHRGTGEWLRFTSDSTHPVRQISFIPGLAKSQALFVANNRVKTVTIFCDDVPVAHASLEDSIVQQTIRLPDNIAATEIKIKVDDIYRGGKFDDLCVSAMVID